MVNIYEGLRAVVEEEKEKAILREKTRKANAERRRVETHAKCIIGGAIHKYYPEAYSFDKDEWCIIAKTVVETDEFKNVISRLIKEEKQRQLKVAKDDYALNTKPAGKMQKGKTVKTEAEYSQDLQSGTESGEMLKEKLIRNVEKHTPEYSTSSVSDQKEDEKIVYKP